MIIKAIGNQKNKDTIDHNSIQWPSVCDWTLGEGDGERVNSDEHRFPYVSIAMTASEGMLCCQPDLTNRSCSWTPALSHSTNPCVWILEHSKVNLRMPHRYIPSMPDCGLHMFAPNSTSCGTLVADTSFSVLESSLVTFLRHAPARLKLYVAVWLMMKIGCVQRNYRKCMKSKSFKSPECASCHLTSAMFWRQSWDIPRDWVQAMAHCNNSR